MVGTEAVSEQHITPDQLALYIGQVRSGTGSSVPIATAEEWNKWVLQTNPTVPNPDLAAVAANVDVILVDVYPYYEGLGISGAADYAIERVRRVQAAYPGKTVLIGETGWPSQGETYGQAVTSLANEEAYAAAILERTAADGIGLLYFEAFDEAWKIASTGMVNQGNFGLFTSQRNAKISLSNSPATADMILRQGSTGDYEIYDLANNQILAAAPLGQVGANYLFAGLGGFSNGDTTDMLLRDGSTGAFEVYDISNNNITAAAALGAVGLNWQLAGFGNFNGPGPTTDMMLRDSNIGTFELYDINNNMISGVNVIGAVGLDWHVAGFGDFNGDGTTDMMLRNSTSGSFEAYDIVGGQLVSATSVGAVGSDWQVAGFAEFNGPGTTAGMMLRNTATGVFELYTIDNNMITSASAIGAVGLDWAVAGFGPLDGAGSADMVLRNVNSGAFEVYDIVGGRLAGAAALGAVGLDWQVGGIAADPLTLFSNIVAR